MRHLLLAGVLALAAACGAAAPPALAPGQAWTFADAPSEEARIVIGHVEPFGEGKATAVSVSIIGLPEYQDGELTMEGDITQLAFDENALRPSLLELVDEDAALPENYEGAYSFWQDAVYGEGQELETDPPAEILAERYGIKREQ